VSQDEKFGLCFSTIAKAEGSSDAGSYLGHYEYKDQTSGKLIQDFGSRSSQLRGLGCFWFGANTTRSSPSVNSPLSILSGP